MNRITGWITVTLAVVALAGAYEISRHGDGKPSAPASSASAKPDDGRAGATQDEHTGKPGENK